MTRFARHPLSTCIALALSAPVHAASLDLTFNYRLTPTDGSTVTIATAHFEDVTDHNGRPAVDLRLTNVASNALPGVGATSYISGLLLSLDFQPQSLPGIVVDQFTDDNAQSDRWEPQEDVATVDGFTFSSELGFPRSETPTTTGARLAPGESGHVQFQDDGSLPAALTVGKLIQAIRGASASAGAPKIMAAVKIRSIPNLSGGEIIESVPTFVIGAGAPVTVGTENRPPVANAGADTPVRVGATGTLDGIGSSDPDNDPITAYEWLQTGGTPVTLSSAIAQKPNFTAPIVPGLLTFSLKVSDGQLQSQTDTVSVNVVADNHAPTVNAGIDVTVTEGSRVILQGSATDSDGDSVSYQWEQISGSPVTLANTKTSSLEFAAPWLVEGSETMEFRLTASDNFSPSLATTDTIKVQVDNDAGLLDCSHATATRTSLWPANGGFVKLGIAGITGPATNGGNPTFDVKITRVTQDEPVRNPAAKDKTRPDAKIAKAKRSKRKPLGQDTVFLRAERQGTQTAEAPFSGNGRVYVIAFSARDETQSCDGAVKVQVPFSMDDTAMDDGQNHISTRK